MGKKTLYSFFLPTIVRANMIKNRIFAMRFLSYIFIIMQQNTYHKRQKEPIWIAIIRVALAFLFLFSGLSKAIDPVASAIQMDDYFISFGMGFLHPIALWVAVLMNIVEFTLGFMLLFKIKVRFTSVIFLLFMLFFLLLTLWLWVAEYHEVNNLLLFGKFKIQGVVKDCGCFGKAIEINNRGTFLKNVIIMIPTLILFFKRGRIPDIRLTGLGQCLLTLIGVLIAAFLQFYCYRHLPVIDLNKDWKKGSNLAITFTEEPDRIAAFFTYQNKKDSSILVLDKEAMMSITDRLPLFYDEYEYLDRRDSIIEPGREPKVEGFSMLDSTGSDYALPLLNPTHLKPLFILVMNDLREVNIEGLQNENLQTLVNEAKKGTIEIVGLTTNTPEEAHAFAKFHHLDFPIYCNNPFDPAKGPFIVRDAIRSNPGLILIQGGVVLQKWAWRDFPAWDKIKY